VEPSRPPGDWVTRIWNLSQPSRVYTVVEAMTEDKPRSEETQDAVASAPRSMDPNVPAQALIRSSKGSVSSIDLELLYREQRQTMVGLARLLTGSFEIAEELVQEAFLKLQLATSVPQNPQNYLRSIVTNLARGHLRRLRLERTRRLETRIVVPTPEVDETWTAICRLPFRQRAVVALRYYEDLPEADIAEVLGCRLGTVKSAHHRALISLRRQLS
jgi:RNA polymerase sigma factor (sigma-70 family)